MTPELLNRPVESATTPSNTSNGGTGTLLSLFGTIAAAKLMQKIHRLTDL
jgi:hypothetical protein